MKKKSFPFHLLVFFTYGVSLKEWDDKGLISREILVYKKMVDQGNRVTFVTYGGKQDIELQEKTAGIEVIPVYHYFGKSRSRVLNLFISLLIPIRLRKLFQSADIYKTNQMSGAWVPLIGKLLYAKPLVIRCGFEMLRNMLRAEKKRAPWLFKAVLGYLLELFSYTGADHIIISNESDITFIRNIYPVPLRKISLIRNYIDTDCFSFKETGNRLSSGPAKVLYIGRLEPCKNIDNLIRGVRLADCGLDIIGDGDQREHLEALARKEKARIRFLGTVENNKLPELIADYDLCVLPSLYECSPKTILECMACRKLVMGTRVEGIKELILDNRTGFLCETTAGSIADTIKIIFLMDESRLSEISDNARQFVVNECSLGRIHELETRIYRQTLQ